MPEQIATVVEDERVVWRLPDPAGQLDRVRLWSDFDLGDARFRRGQHGWELPVRRETLPAVSRLEYLFEVTSDDRTMSILDPGNPRRVGGAFGDHSWVSLGYREPGWLQVTPVPGERQPIRVLTPAGDVDVEIWSPASSERNARLPLLLCHDGPEMDVLGELTRFVGSMIAVGRLAPLRVGLLDPGARNERYAANAAYADALCEIVLPTITALAPTQGRPVLAGQSLGAVAALHAEWTHPGTFGGLLLQSGSFFTPELDGHESGFSGWGPVTAFVADVLRTPQPPSRPEVAVCFGSAEENAANNRQLAGHLEAVGLPMSVGEVRDGHTFTCWRDLLDPHLTDLLGRV